MAVLVIRDADLAGLGPVSWLQPPGGVDEFLLAAIAQNLRKLAKLIAMLQLQWPEEVTVSAHPHSSCRPVTSLRLG